MSITPVPCLRDNYAYLIHQEGASQAWVVDPSEAPPVERALEDAGLELAGVIVTHHHPDHVGGIPALLDARGSELPVLGFEGDAARIPGINRTVQAVEGRFSETGLELFGSPLEAMHIPGHTTGALAWRLGEEVFTGDTLFAAGCGRLFEGTPAMMHASLQALCALPEATRLWFGHEYTAANLRFALTVEPDNVDMQARAAAGGDCTTPTTVSLERATNPFVRAEDAEALARIRTAKDGFRG